jgi:hypothetical protein
MSTKNIYYTSNSSANIFPQNSRGGFNSQIDENEFQYIDFKEISVAVKSVTFENKYNLFTSEYGLPNMVILQDNKNIDPVLAYEGIYASPLNIDLASGLDYYFLPETQKPYGVGKNFEPRNFTDIKLFCNVYMQSVAGSYDYKITNFVVHNIYFHGSSAKTSHDIIDYLNYVYSNIEWDGRGLDDHHPLDRNNLFTLHSEDHALFHDKSHLDLDIFLSNELSQTLGFNYEDLEKSRVTNLQKLVDKAMLQRKDKNDYRYEYNDIQILTDNIMANSILQKQWHSDVSYFSHSKITTSTVKSGRKIDIHFTKPKILGIRTNLSNFDIFKNCKYDTQVEFINVRDCDDGIQIYQVKNPSFLESRLEKISNAKFELIDIATGKIPNFSIGTPTYIHLLAADKSRMSKKFNIFLDSSDSKSKEYFPNNTSADFTIRLPERLEFNKRWEVTLRNIFLGNDMFNIYSDSCWLKINMVKTVGFGNLSGPPNPNMDDQVGVNEKHISLADGKFSSIERLSEYIDNRLKEENVKLNIKLENGLIQLECYEPEEHTTSLAKYVLKFYTLTVSPFLSNILGFDRSTITEKKIEFDKEKTFLATYRPNISLLVPTNFIILCDLLTESVFGSNSIKILRLISSDYDPSKEIQHFTFHHDEFIELNIREFLSIRIQIADTTGNLIKSTHSHPTRCQIQFVKK